MTSPNERAPAAARSYLLFHCACFYLLGVIASAPGEWHGAGIVAPLLAVGWAAWIKWGRR